MIGCAAILVANPLNPFLISFSFSPIISVEESRISSTESNLSKMSSALSANLLDASAAFTVSFDNPLKFNNLLTSPISSSLSMDFVMSAMFFEKSNDLKI